MLDELLVKYGMPILLCGCIVLAFVGLIKLITKKTGNEKIIKFYPLIAIAISALCCAGYYLINDMSFDLVACLSFTSAVYACSQALYPIYENYGGRALFLALLALLESKTDPIYKE